MKEHNNVRWPILELLRATGPDRATVPLGRWQDKVQRYPGYFRSSVFDDRYQASKPFLVLTVTTSAERLANMKRVTDETGARRGSGFYYAALADPAEMLHRPTWLMADRSEAAGFPYPLHMSDGRIED